MYLPIWSLITWKNTKSKLWKMNSFIFGPNLVCMCHTVILETKIE